MITIKTGHDFSEYNDLYVEVDHVDFEAYYEPSSYESWRFRRKNGASSYESVERECLPFNEELVRLLFVVTDEGKI